MNQDMGFKLKLHHFGISVPNLEETVSWYGEKLGFKLDYKYRMEDLDANVAFMTLNDFRVEIFELPNASAMPTSSLKLDTDLKVYGLKHVALAVDDLEQAIAVLQKQGIEFITEAMEVPNSRGERFAFFKDNNGIFIEVYQPNSQNDN